MEVVFSEERVRDGGELCRSVTCNKVSANELAFIVCIGFVAVIVGATVGDRA